MARTKRPNPSEKQICQLASILSRQDQPREPIQPSRNEVRNTNIDFESALPQSQVSLFSKIPPEVRFQIYLELWREAGLVQHISSDFPWGNRHYHCKCIGGKAREPDDTEPPPPETAETEEAEWDPEVGPPPRWDENCFHCCSAFDSRTDEETEHPPCIGTSSFLHMLLSCKRIHLEVLESIGRNVCFKFRSIEAGTFICQLRPPIVDQLRHIYLMKATLDNSGWQSDRGWIFVTKLLYQLPKLQRITLFMEGHHYEWRDNKPRRDILNPRLCFWFVWLPPHIELKVSIPCDSLEDEDSVGVRFFNFLKMTGGLVEGATLDMILGDDYPETRPEVEHYPRLELPE